jgi:hypothetical protein
MPTTDTARKNHEELFPNQRSTLNHPDLELVEVFDNFAFDAFGTAISIRKRGSRPYWRH